MKPGLLRKEKREEEGMETHPSPSEMNEKGEGKRKPNTMQFVNLQHSKVAMAILCHQLTVGMADTALIQHPFIYGAKYEV
jgi:hypothetical protein